MDAFDGIMAIVVTVLVGLIFAVFLLAYQQNTQYHQDREACIQRGGVPYGARLEDRPKARESAVICLRPEAVV
jgi:hypothetical protein